MGYCIRAEAYCVTLLTNKCLFSPVWLQNIQSLVHMFVCCLCNLANWVFTTQLERLAPVCECVCTFVHACLSKIVYY